MSTPIRFAAPDAAGRDRLTQLGQVASLLARSPQDAATMAARLQRWIEPALGFGHVQVFHDTLGNDVGYVVWALLAPDVEQRLRNAAPLGLHVSEWTEGEALWILDFVALKGQAKNILRFARQAMFEGHACARYVRRHQDGGVRKLVTVRRRASAAEGSR